MSDRVFAKSMAMRIPALRQLVAQRDALLAERDQQSVGITWVPPGHFYSPIPSYDEVRRRHHSLFRDARASLPGIDLRTADQKALLEELMPYYAEMPFPLEADDRFRYFFENPAYSYADAILLHCMLRKWRPKHLIEVGSGFSSAMTMDTNDHFLGREMRLTFIDPYPDLLRSLMRPSDEGHEVIEAPVQEVPPAAFEQLGENDVLFIDSTHVSKIGSDVNYLYLEILPRLAPGVLVHIHDVFTNFEYPAGWVYEGRS